MTEAESETKLRRSQSFRGERGWKRIQVWICLKPGQPKIRWRAQQHILSTKRHPNKHLSIK